jgi:hypothetical protein
VDDAGGGGCLVAGSDGPCAGFLFAGGEVGAESEEVVDAPDEAGDAGTGDAEVCEVGFGVVFREVDEFRFDGGADDDGFGVVAVFDEVDDFADVGVGGGVGGGRGEIAFGDIAGEDGGFACEEEEEAELASFVVVQFSGDGWFAGVEVGDEFLAEGGFRLGFLVVLLCFFDDAFEAFLDRLEVGENEFGIDDIDVADGVD